MTSERRQRRIGENEASFRAINERLEQGLRQVRHPHALHEFVCECGDRACADTVCLSFAEYEEVRRDGRRFAVVPGHVFPETERVVERGDHFEVVEKTGAAILAAEAADPRS